MTTPARAALSFARLAGQLIALGIFILAAAEGANAIYCLRQGED